MAESNVVVQEIKLTKDGIFDLEELFKLIKEWYSFHKYDFFEKDYKDVLNYDSKKIDMETNSEKVVSEYIKYHVELKLSVNNHKYVISKEKKKKLVKGELIIILSSYITSDTSSQWSGNPIKKFIRGVYDKYIEGDKISRFSSELKEETYSFYNELKAFLNLQRF